MPWKRFFLYEFWKVRAFLARDGATLVAVPVPIPDLVDLRLWTVPIRPPEGRVELREDR